MGKSDAPITIKDGLKLRMDGEGKKSSRYSGMFFVDDRFPRRRNDARGNTRTMCEAPVVMGEVLVDGGNARCLLEE